MPRFILTGTPGAGKTSILTGLERQGHQVVSEAATDVVARRQACGEDELWTRPSFIDDIVAEQIQRQTAAVMPEHRWTSHRAMSRSTAIFERAGVWESGTASRFAQARTAGSP
ncbi:AAA family ATPase [Streptomyces sp. NPDC005529]|uniref:AAA family ATPase n=1 Tax=unclassified Streptomyces TaxID=2593676 RepID=UPI00339F22C1